MAALELMRITKDWVSFFVILCQAFTAADFSCCLFVGLFASSFVFSKWNACSIGLKSGDWLGFSLPWRGSSNHPPLLSSGRPGLFMLLSSPVHSCFLRMYQTVDLTNPNVPAISLMDLFCLWSLTIVCFSCMESSLTAWCGFTATASNCKWHT